MGAIKSKEFQPLCNDQIVVTINDQYDQPLKRGQCILNSIYKSQDLPGMEQPFICLFQYNHTLQQLHIKKHDYPYKYQKKQELQDKFNSHKDTTNHLIMFEHSDVCPNRIYAERCQQAQHSIQYSSRLTNLAVCCVIFDSDDYLLSTRRQQRMMFFPKAWVIPGGHVETQELPEYAALREAGEETGIEIVQSLNAETQKFEYFYKDQPCSDLQMFYAFESATYKDNVNSFEAAKSTHMILFYKIKLPVSRDKVQLNLQYSEVDQAVWLSEGDIKNLLAKTETDQVFEGYEPIDKSGAVRKIQVQQKQLLPHYPNPLGEGLSKAHTMALDYYFNRYKQRD
ncbi:nudix hydrolase family protein [Stylonychia lemnae]|uniref:Nudix hydrolase family protein n=1 Tax=Stylonychia lemnae TaxID=5949 RepID=A0A078ANA2_STYLE|nr:nudix hydrolase family protein [Stylonychia lemnae]|eukprot:CDW82822.1 nudix hydrolase family protein [Stylonychia lemnae]